MVVMHNSINEFLKDKFSNNQFLLDAELNQFTYTKIGGKADFIVFPENKEQLSSLLSFCSSNNIKTTILGNASNVLISEEGIRGVVIILTKLKNTSVEQVSEDIFFLTCQAGDLIIDVSKLALEHSLTGLEFACGIPGSMGGAAYMNAGAYGGELKDIFHSALVCDEEGNFLTLSNEEMNFGYRQSVLQEKKYIVINVTLRLKKGIYSEIEDKMKHLTFLRESKQPLEYPSCGSVFKRPPGHFAGQLIQEAGLQGHRIGGAEVSKKHAGFIVNVDNATSSDYLGVIEYVQQKVFEKHGVKLEREVRILK